MGLFDVQGMDNYNVVYAPIGTKYLTLSGDMPPVTDIGMREYTIPFALSNYLKTSAIEDLKERFKMLPRDHANDIIIQTMNTMPEMGLKIAVGTNMLELFNQANKKAIEEQGIVNPWDWEELKYEAIARAQATAEFDTELIDSELSLEALEQSVALEKRAHLEQRFVMLEPIKDKTSNIQRSVAFSLLLDKGNYESAELILEFYETLSPEMKEILQTLEA